MVKNLVNIYNTDYEFVFRKSGHLGPLTMEREVFSKIFFNLEQILLPVRSIVNKRRAFNGRLRK